MVTLSSTGQDVVFRAIAAPPRREILRLLRGGPRSVGDLASNFSQSRPAISKHLRLLREAGLVVARERGTTRMCELNARPLRAVDRWLREYEALWSTSLRSLKRYIEDNP